MNIPLLLLNLLITQNIEITWKVAFGKFGHVEDQRWQAQEVNH